eukprot:SAG31_NODE_15053_length_773_cov_0.903561_1_plen_78_part_00
MLHQIVLNLPSSTVHGKLAELLVPERLELKNTKFSMDCLHCSAYLPVLVPVDLFVFVSFKKKHEYRVPDAPVNLKVS